MSVNCVNENGETQFHESNCIECEEVDDMNMVQCDECDRWAHFRCVGVGLEIENSCWCCRLCNTTISGLSLTETKKVDASVGTEAEPPSFGTDASALVGSSNVSSRATGAQSLNVNVSTKALTSDDTCLKLVKEENDLLVAHIELDDKETFEFYKTKLKNFGGSDMNETVREIGQTLIADSVLMKYSYLGRRQKLRFKNFDNLTKLVVASTIASMKRRYFEVHEKAMIQSDDEAKKLYTDVEKYFTTEYIKKAKTRFDRSLE